MSFLIFLGDFLNIAAKITINKQGKILQIKEAINNELKATIINQDQFNKLNTYINLL